MWMTLQQFVLPGGTYGHLSSVGAFCSDLGRLHGLKAHVLSLQLPKEVPVHAGRPNSVPAPNARPLRDTVLLCRRVHSVPIRHPVPAADQPGGKLHAAVSPTFIIIIAILNTSTIINS